MMFKSLLADASMNTSIGSSEVTFEAARLQTLTQPWQYAVFACLGLAVLAFSWWMYRRDSVELKAGSSWFLLATRISTFVALILFFIQYEKRVDQLDVHPSRVLILVDTSLSMMRVDDVQNESQKPQSRLDQVKSTITKSSLISDLRKTHYVDLYSFDQNPKPNHILTLSKLESTTIEIAETASNSDEPLTLERIYQIVPIRLWQILLVILGISFALSLLWILRQRPQNEFSIGQWCWALLGWLMPAVPVIVLIVLIVQQRNVIEQKRISADAANPKTSHQFNDEDSSSASSSKITRWQQTVISQLTAKGAETRIGQALTSLLHTHHSDPVAGIILFSDGGQNAGISVQAAIKLAKQFKVPIFPIGIGSDKQPANVRIIDFAAPSRVHPDDNFTITATIGANQLEDHEKITVELLSVEGTPKQNSIYKQVDSKPVKLPKNGKLETVKFEVTPDKIGRYTYKLRLDAPAEDTVAEDNVAYTTVEVVDRKLRVLLFAGGPTREYRYLRNQLYRDKDVIVDVLLQTVKSRVGVSQDADQLLLKFPKTKKDLAKYDCIVAFDPDWRTLKSEQVDLLEDWVGSQSGGLIAIAGPVYTSTWASNSSAPTHMVKIRTLYPVIFPRTMSRFDHQKFRSKTSWKISMTRAGAEASFLYLEDDAALNLDAWDSFAGVYGYYPVRGPKAGALVYGRYDDPRAAKDTNTADRLSGDTAPVYFAGHYYGSGRVFYLGSGEMWRVRALSESYFEQFYTKLIRYVSEGRLNQGSKRGSLFVDRKFIVGETITIRAKLMDAQLEPLKKEKVRLQVLGPNQKLQEINLIADSQRAGFYKSQFVGKVEGSYQLELKIPKSNEVLSSIIRCVVPNKESQLAVRNDSVLIDIADAKNSDGLYYQGIDSIQGSDKQPKLNSNFKDITRITRITGNPSFQWDRRWAICLLGMIAFTLFLQWTIRRTLKLA